MSKYTNFIIMDVHECYWMQLKKNSSKALGYKLTCYICHEKGYFWKFAQS